jgi:3-hydroxybutyryl-CoA dehydrogenase
MTTGVNYPRGLLAWGDQIGAGEILRRLERLQARYGDPRYRPSPRIAEIIAGQGTLLSG